MLITPRRVKVPEHGEELGVGSTKMGWARDIAGGAFAYLSVPCPNPPELTRKWQQGKCQQPSAFSAPNVIPHSQNTRWDRCDKYTDYRC